MSNLGTFNTFSIESSSRVCLKPRGMKTSPLCFHFPSVDRCCFLAVFNLKKIKFDEFNKDLFWL